MEKEEKVNSLESDTSIEMEDFKDDKTEISYSPLAHYVTKKFDEAETARRPIEHRMAKAWTNFRGTNETETKFTSTEKSKAFIKITKTKVVAGVGQVYDIIFSDGKLPIGVKPTPVPEGIPEKAHFDQSGLNGADPEKETEQEISFGFDGDGEEIEPGAGIMSRLKEVTKKAYGALPFTEGPAENGELEISPSQLAANEMHKEIQDQLSESHATEEFAKAIYEAGLLGSGCIKGPFTEVKEYPNWETDEEGNRTYKPNFVKVPKSEQVSIWAIYPDPNASTVEDAEYVIQRHRMSDYQLRSCGAKPGFRPKIIDEIIDMEHRAEKAPWEHTVQESETDEDSRHLVLEFWGNVETAMFGAEFEKNLPKDIRKQKNMQANIWVCNNRIIRMAINPFLPKRIPYHIFHWEKDLYNFFGVGIAENMEDSQMLTNGFWRLAIDNAALAGNMVFEADEMNLAPGQDLTIHPGKIIRRRAGAPGQALFSHKFNTTAFDNIQIMEKAMQLADTSTGIPAVSHGQPAGTVGRTAMGMSMMMGAAGLNIKTVIRNLDQQALKPLGEAYFAWNMQFSDKKFLKGDLSIVATGTDNLLQKEVKSQRLLQFLQIATANPVTAPLVNAEKLLQDIAMTLDLDSEEVINSPKKQQAVAAMLQAAQASQGGPNGTNIPTGENGPMSAQDATGGGGGQAGVGDPMAAQANNQTPQQPQ